MPTVLLIEGFRFFFFSGDQFEPAHVHVKKGDGDGKIWLDPIEVAYLIDFKVKEEKRILEIVNENRQQLIDAWHAYFSK